MEDKRKYHSNPKRSPKRNRSKQRETYNVSTDDMENAISTNQGGGIRFGDNPRNRKDTASGPEVQGEQDKTEKSSYGVDWLQKGI